MKTLYAAVAAFAAVAMAPAANATAFVVPLSVSGLDFTADYGNQGLAGAFTDTFTFAPFVGDSLADVTFIQGGTGTKALTLLSLDIDGIPLLFAPGPGGTVSFTLNLPLTGALHVLTVSGVAGGNASYSGTVNFTATPSVPEPATWAMMVAGIGAVGVAMRRRSQTARVAFS